MVFEKLSSLFVCIFCGNLDVLFLCRGTKVILCANMRAICRANIDNIFNTGQLWIPDVRGVAGYYVFVTKKIVKLEQLEGHCGHLPSSHCDFYVSHCCGGCGQALGRAGHQGAPYAPRK